MKLSILLPTFNDSCLSLATALSRQMALLDVETELLVADDGSTDEMVKAENRQIASLPRCRVLWAERNMGRAAIRNFLADEAQGEWLLFIDGDLHVRREDFLQHYLDETTDASVVYGGYSIEGEPHQYARNLRYLVERRAEKNKTLEARRKHPYRHFHTANFALRSDVFHRIRFHSEMTHYGFEDVLFGKELQTAGIAIHHIDNPVAFDRFETNETFLRKTEESVRTQHEFTHLIGEYSNLLHTYNAVQRWHLAWLLSLTNLLLPKALRHHLLCRWPNVTFFNIHKLLMFSRLRQA